MRMAPNEESSKLKRKLDETEPELGGSKRKQLEEPKVRRRTTNPRVQMFREIDEFEGREKAKEPESRLLK